MARMSFSRMLLLVLISLGIAAVPSLATAQDQDMVTVPARTMLLVKMQTLLETGKVSKGDVFTAVLEKPVIVDGRTVFPRGVKAHGHVVDAVEVGNISGRPALAIYLVGIETKSGTVSIKTLSQGFVGTTQGTVNSVITGNVVGPTGPGIVINSSGQVTVKPGALIEFSLLEAVVVK